MNDCAHARRWFYRSAFKFTAGRPSVDIQERCQDCTALVRNHVPKAELEAKGLLVSMLDVWRQP